MRTLCHCTGKEWWSFDSYLEERFKQDVGVGAAAPALR